MYELPERVVELLDRGVVVPMPGAVRVAADVSMDRISSGAVLHPGTRLSGSETAIGDGAEIGEEGPAVVHNCQLGEGVKLKGGSYFDATFLDGSSMGSGAHVREGTLLEEQASGAHTVGFKQTILMPFVTAGSLINFCDCLMAGGTDRRNHSEIGSSYVHFNYTPHQDKATASLIGDVPRGVLLDQAPIFLGGQGGLVGPARIGYGTVIAAGTIWRGDATEGEKLLMDRRKPVKSSVPYHAGVFGPVSRIVSNNLIYLGNLFALRAWYTHVRAPFMQSQDAAQACYEGALSQLKKAIGERIKRLEQLAQQVARSDEVAGSRSVKIPDGVAKDHKRLMDAWPGLQETLSQGPADGVGIESRDAALEALHGSGDRAYLDAVKDLSDDGRQSVTKWLQEIVDSVSGLWNPASLMS